ncbi:MAG TPA: pentapeptide repeat-containing protein [Tepidisphaeraceae bacterium]|jgi:uncharacterized protein YjbI with pentapeptide repeats
MSAGGVATGAVLKRLLGQTICFSGKFGWGVQDRLQKLAEAQQGLVVETLDASVNLLVLPDLNSGKTVQKKAASLNAKGASIQVIDADDFEKRVTPDLAEFIALLHSGPSAREVIAKIFSTIRPHASLGAVQPAFLIASESFADHNLSGFELGHISFIDCRFDGAKLDGARFGSVERCSFVRSDCSNATFGNILSCDFADASLVCAEVYGNLKETSIAGARADGLNVFGYPAGSRTVEKSVFRGASLDCARFHRIKFSAADFEGAILSSSVFDDCNLSNGNFRSAKLSGANLTGCDLKGADFSNADLTRSNLADADLTEANVRGANLADAHLRDAVLNNVDFSTAKGYDPVAAQGGSAGPAMTQLDSVTATAKRIQIAFHVDGGTSKAANNSEIQIDSAGLQYGWGVRLPNSVAAPIYRRTRGGKQMSDALLEAARAVGSLPVRFETIEVNTTKSPLKANELRQVVIDAVAEAFRQRPPEKEKRAELTKAWREQRREADAVDRERREAARKLQEQQEAERKRQIEQTVRKAVGKVTDIATFLKALELRADKQKIDKATKMLKASGFQLFNDLTAEHLLGVVKSQTDPDLVYACRIDHEGHYACCTQNLNICGGLRGSICKHLLVLIIGLVKAGELDPAAIDGWVAKTHDTKPELDKEAMGEIFIRYKGAEAGEVDWRPTETVPEDYYAL